MDALYIMGAWAVTFLAVVGLAVVGSLTVLGLRVVSAHYDEYVKSLDKLPEGISLTSVGVNKSGDPLGPLPRPNGIHKEATSRA